jgi:hypothetical protein
MYRAVTVADIYTSAHLVGRRLAPRSPDSRNGARRQSLSSALAAERRFWGCELIPGRATGSGRSGHLMLIVGALGSAVTQGLAWTAALKAISCDDRHLRRSLFYACHLLATLLCCIMLSLLPARCNHKLQLFWAAEILSALNFKTFLETSGPWNGRGGPNRGPMSTTSTVQHLSPSQVATCRAGGR